MRILFFISMLFLMESIQAIYNDNDGSTTPPFMEGLSSSIRFISLPSLDELASLQEITAEQILLSNSSTSSTSWESVASSSSTESSESDWHQFRHMHFIKMINQINGPQMQQIYGIDEETLRCAILQASRTLKPPPTTTQDYLSLAAQWREHKLTTFRSPDLVGELRLDVSTKKNAVEYARTFQLPLPFRFQDFIAFSQRWNDFNAMNLNQQIKKDALQYVITFQQEPPLLRTTFIDYALRWQNFTQLRLDLQIKNQATYYTIVFKKTPPTTHNTCIAYAEEWRRYLANSQLVNSQ